MFTVDLARHCTRRRSIHDLGHSASTPRISVVKEEAMKTTRQDYFDKTVAEWAAADAECTRLYMLWNEACEHRRRLARAKNQAWREMNAERVTELSNGQRGGEAS
jgi:hypothetical protein